MKYIRLRWFCALCALSLFPWQLAASSEKPLRWYGHIYGGTMIEESFLATPMQLHSLDFLDSRLVAVGAGRELYHMGDYLTLEGEGQVVQHIGNIDHHTEFTMSANIRWQKFPWDKWLDTSVAWGHGLSYATKKSQVEKDDFGGETSNILYYMALEADAIWPGQEDWSVFARIHHRSGIFGTINNVDGGVNALTAGVRKRF